jgi:hypothetical protein
MADRDRQLRAGGMAGAVLALALTVCACLGCGDEGGEMAINNVDPRAGHLAGEEPVKIIGENFRTDIGYTVYFGTKRATSVTILDPSTILVTTPMVDDPATVDITLTADNGPAFRIAQAFSFEDRSEDGAGAAAAKKSGNLAY